MRLSKNHLDYMAFLVYKGLKEHPNVKLLDADKTVSIVRRRMIENLKMEEELEEEAERMLAPHRAEIIRTGADYGKMLAEGKRTLAKKRGFVI